MILYSRPSKSHGQVVGDTIVALAKIVASRWTTAPKLFNVDGLSVDYGDVSARWATKAAGLAKTYGSNAATVRFRRVDDT